MASSPDLTCMDKPAVHSFRSYGSTTCGNLPLLSSGVFGTVSVWFAVVSIYLALEAGWAICSACISLKNKPFRQIISGHTHTNILWSSWIMSRTTWVSRHQKDKTKRWWVAVASAGPYACLHLDPDI